MGVALSGLASGMDWQTTVQQLIAVERSAQDPFKTQRSLLSKKLSGLDTIKNSLLALQTAANTLKKGTSDYYTRKVTMDKDTSTTNSNMSASATGTTPLGSYTFNILQKATSTALTGDKIGAALTDTSKTLASLNIAAIITQGNFTVNGQTISIATTDTLQSVFDEIATATGGEVTAALVSDRVVLTGHDIGNGQPRITLGSAADTSNFLEAMHLFSDTGTVPAATVQSDIELGATNINTALVNALDTGSLTGLTDGSGSFTINGKTITYNINTSSIRSIMNSINNSGAGVLANYDTGTGNLVITNVKTGSTGITMTDTTGILTQLKLTAGAGATTAYGVNAQFKINGSDTVLTSNSNTLSEQITGIPGLTVNVKDTGTDTINVAADTSAAKANIQAFITAYNKLNTDVASLTKITINSDESVTAAVLADNREVANWLSTIRSSLFGEVDTGTTGITRLYHLGLDFKKEDGSLYIKESADLDEALEDDPNAVAKLFNKTGTGPTNEGAGLGNTISNYIQKVVDGSYKTQKTSLNNQSDNITKQLATMERKVLADQDKLTQSFLAMESALQRINQQSQIFNSYFG